MTWVIHEQNEVYHLFVALILLLNWLLFISNLSFSSIKSSKSTTISTSSNSSLSSFYITLTKESSKSLEVILIPLLIDIIVNIISHWGELSCIKNDNINSQFTRLVGKRLSLEPTFSKEFTILFITSSFCKYKIDVSRILDHIPKFYE